MNRMQQVLNRIFTVVTWKPALTIAIAFSLAGFSIFYTVTNLGFQTSQRDLISPDHHLIQLAERVDQFDDMDNFIVTIENSNTSRSLDFLRTLVAKLEEDKEHVAQVFYRIDPDSLRKWALLYPDREDLLALRDNLREHQDFIRNLAASPEMTNFYQLVNNKIASAMVGELFTGFLNDDQDKDEDEPFDLSFLTNSLKSLDLFLENEQFKSPWGALFAEGSWDEDKEGYFWTENERYLLAFVTPVEQGEGFNNARQSLEALRATVAEVFKDFPDIQAGVTGREAMNVDEMSSAFEDMSVATIISLVALTTLLISFWRGVRRPLLEVTELAISLCLTFGLTTLVVGHLNILSIVFAPLQLGLGIDYGIHWLERYREEWHGKLSAKREAIRTTMVKLGPGIILAGLTTVCSFFPLVLTGFQGLVELGVICSIGMAMTTCTTIFVLPALISVFDKPKARRKFTHVDGRPLFSLTNRRVIAILVFSSASLIISAIAATGVTFDLNMLNLQSKDAESVIWEKKMLDDSKRSSMHGAVLARSIDEVRAKSKRLEALPTVSKVESIETILPQNQREKIQILRQIKPFIPDPASFQATGKAVNISELDRTLSRIRFKMLDSSKEEWGDKTPLEEQMVQVRELISRIRHSFNTLDATRLQIALQDYDARLMDDLNDKLDLMQSNANASPMRIGDLPTDILERFVGEDGIYLIRVFPEQDIWEPELLGKFVADLTSVDPEAVGDPVTLYVFTKAFRDACVKAAIYAVIFISVLLLLTFRSLPNVLLAMMPLLVGTTWTLGLMRVYGVNLNLANSLFLPLIVGKGIEYGIIIMQRWTQQNGSGVELHFSTGEGILLAGMTTSVGFASLTLASHRGIFSLGALATTGSLCMVAAAVIFLPAALRLQTMIRERYACRKMSDSEANLQDKCVAVEKKQQI